MCNKQYVGKAKTAFNIRLNNHTKDAKDLNAIVTCKHFQIVGHNFNKHLNFIIIEKYENIKSAKDIFRKPLIQRANFEVWQTSSDLFFP